MTVAHLRTPVVISVAVWSITRRRAHVAERDHSIPEEGGTKGHHILLRSLYIRSYACFAPSARVIARERERYWLLFLRIGILLGPLQIVEPTGQGSGLTFFPKNSATAVSWPPVSALHSSQKYEK